MSETIRQLTWHPLAAEYRMAKREPHPEHGHTLTFDDGQWFTSKQITDAQKQARRIRDMLTYLRWRNR